MSLSSPMYANYDEYPIEWQPVTEDEGEQTWPDFALKWTNCLNVSRSLSSKKVLADWQGPTTKKLEDWGRRVHAHDRSRVWDVESRLQSDPNVHQLLNELFEVLIRHFNALYDCPSSVVSAAPSVANPWESSDTREASPQPRRQSRRRKPRSVASDDCSRCLRRRSRQLPLGETSDLRYSVSEAEQQFLEPKPLLQYARSESHWSAETGLASSMEPRRQSSNLRITMIDESKNMVDVFITQLFDFAESLHLTPPPVATDQGPGLPGPTQYRDGSYRQAHKTAADMVPYAEKYMLDRISRAASIRLRELTEAKWELGAAFRNSTYYPGRYTHDNPGMIAEILRRVSSLPPSAVISDQGSESGKGGEGRRHRSFPLSSRASQNERLDPLFRDDLISGVGAFAALQPRQSPEDAHGGGSQSPKLAQTGETRPSAGGADNSHLYICFVESCPAPFKIYDSRASWGAHLRTAHPEAISPPKAPTSTCVWVCRAWSHASEPGGYPSFDDEDLFREHMSRLHSDAFFGDRDFLAAITQASLQQRQPSQPPPRPTCPLCRLDYDEIRKISRSNHEDDDEDSNPLAAGDQGTAAFLDHVADHCDRINRRIMSSVPPLEISGVRPGRWQRTILEPSRGSLATGLESNVWVKDNVGRLPVLSRFKADLEDFGSEAGTVE